MKYCSSIWFTAGLCEEPTIEKTLLTKTPRVQGPGWVRATSDGPMLNFPWPTSALVAVGITIVGPVPQINLPGFAGDRKNVGFMSPKPDCPPTVLARYGCQTIG